MGVIKNILLLPFLPLRLAWRWSSEAKINGVQNGFAHLLGTIIIAVILYSLIGWGIMTLIDVFSK